jgi:hypothetical protein
MGRSLSEYHLGPNHAKADNEVTDKIKMDIFATRNNLLRSA